MREVGVLPLSSSRLGPIRNIYEAEFAQASRELVESNDITINCVLESSYSYILRFKFSLIVPVN